jgi:hypothetical protein
MLLSGRLPHGQHQLAMLFQHDVGCSMDQVLTEPVRDRRQ